MLTYSRHLYNKVFFSKEKNRSSNLRGVESATAAT